MACAPGTYDDGTGSAQNPTLDRDLSEGPRKKFAQEAKSKFKSTLADPENNYFRKEVLSSSGLSLNPVCNGAEDKPSEGCLNLMAEGAADVEVKRMERGSGMGFYGSSEPTISDESYLTESAPFKDVEGQLLSDFRKSIGQDDINNKIKNKVFPQVKEILLKKIETMVSDPATRKKLIDKVKSIRYDGSDCGNSNSGETIAGILIPNAMYQPSQNTFKFCAGMATQNKSEFQMAFVIGHELAHSIDPCGITRGPSDYSFAYKPNASREEAEQEFPFPGVASCLRSKSSVNAITWKDRQMPGYIGNYPGSSDSNPQDDGKFHSFCKNDQITESFADWMGSEIAPDYIEKNYPALSKEQMRFGYSNIWRGLCQKDDSGTSMFDPDVHPAQTRRTNFLILMQPKIRQQMGCPATVSERIYCKLGGSPPAQDKQHFPIRRSYLDDSTNEGVH